MFRSIGYKLIIFLVLLIAATVTATLCFALGYIWFGLLFTFALSMCLWQLSFHYRKFNNNILFLLNALENGDYSFRFSTTQLSRREKELNAMLNRIRDILIKAREEVIANERFLSFIIESVSTGIIIVDDTNSIRSVNRAAKEMLGLGILTHLAQLRNVDETFPSQFNGMSDRQKIQVSVANEREEYRLNIELSEVELQGRRVRIFALNNIADELETAEMESWIKLIRVMTHEIMNSIAPVTSLSETLLMSYKSSDPDETSLRDNTVEALSTINSTARGLLSFVDSYRQFTRIPNPQPVRLDINELIPNSVALASPYISGDGINLQLFLTEQPAIIEADAGLLLQVLVNLIKNAAEALRTQTDGEIKIEVRKDPHNVYVNVSNNGQIIPDDVLAHIFIPFFTTKEKGTGIGLSLSRYIMRLHGGTLKHHTENGITVFSMVFPSAQ